MTIEPLEQKTTAAGSWPSSYDATPSGSGAGSASGGSSSELLPACVDQQMEMLKHRNSLPLISANYRPLKTHDASGNTLLQQQRPSDETNDHTTSTATRNGGLTPAVDEPQKSISIQFLQTPKSTQVDNQDADEDDDEIFGGVSAKKKSSEDGGTKRKLSERFQRIGLRAMQFVAILLLADLIIYYWPMAAPSVEPQVGPAKPRPRFQGEWALNEQLDQSECLFAQQFHAPESMAWTRDKRAFYTGVEGGFILLVEPYEERWTVVARLNARNAVRDLAGAAAAPTATREGNATGSSRSVPFCTRDIELYGARAEFEPRLVSLSRCSRPLGVRLSPDQKRLYASDPLSGLYRIDVGGASHPSAAKHQVSRLLRFDGAERDNSERDNSTSDVLFADDIAVDWGAATETDIIYMTDCSRRLTLRFLFRLILENDDTGRVLRYDTSTGELEPVANVTPVQMPAAGGLDERRLSFPNGVELSANKSALLISDLNNRRILMHHLRGPLAGQTRHLLWVPGYSDNVRRGLDLPDGRPTYWAACGCAVSDGIFELAEFFNNYPRTKTVLLKSLHFMGWTLERVGSLVDSTSLKDAGLMLRAVWLRYDPYCTHGLVFQFTEDGQVVRSLHAPHFGSLFKLISEAHEVPLLDDHEDAQNRTTNNGSVIYLGSVYYPYLGRLKLNTFFRIDNTDHIFDVNKKLHDHDQVDLVCPQQQPLAFESVGVQAANRSAGAANETTMAQSQERYIIYSVSKEEYDTCRLNGKARVVARCDHAQQGKNRPPFTVTFRSFTPQPNGLEFKPGEDYYFITGLIGDNLEAGKRFSPCRDQNMKVIFKVCCKAAGQPAAAASQAASASGGGVQPPNHQLLAARRPAVVTLRPSLMAPNSPAYKRPHIGPSGSGADGPAEQPARGQAASLASQPHDKLGFTVWPIEVIPTSSEQPAQVSSSSSSNREPASESERNDIVLNEQQPTSSQSQPQPPPHQQPPSLGHILRPPPYRLPQAPSGPQLVPFDPTAPPDIIRNYDPQRWMPTPLPPHLTARQPPPQQQQPGFANNVRVIQQYATWPPREPWRWHKGPPQLRAPETDTERMHPNRKGLYEDWRQYDSVSSGSLTTAADGQQQNASWSARSPNYGLASLATCCSILAVILLAGAPAHGFGPAGRAHRHH